VHESKKCKWGREESRERWEDIDEQKQIEKKIKKTRIIVERAS
jgi:hypothetical protein